MQVRKTQVRICKGGKRKYSNLKSILKCLRFSSLAFSVDPLSVGLDQFTCTVPDRRSWLLKASIGPTRLSVSGRIQRTNNGVESFHNSFGRLVKVSPSKFIYVS